MTEPQKTKLPLLAKRKRLERLPGQPENEELGYVWDAVRVPRGGNAYAVRFVGGGRIEVLGYIDAKGHAYRASSFLSSAPAEDPDLKVVRYSDEDAGFVEARAQDGAYVRVAEYEGSPRGPFTLVSPACPIPLEGPLDYRAFMTALFLTFCHLRPEAVLERAVQKVPVELFDGFDRTPLPDALDALMYRIDQAQTERPLTGIELYARRLLQEAGSSKIRSIALAHELRLAHLESSGAFFINFESSGMTSDDVACVLAVESAMNRLLSLLDGLGAGLSPLTGSPTEPECSERDLTAYARVTADITGIAARLEAPNPWAKPGSVACKPGGEWDVRTRFASFAESLRLLTRLEYRFSLNVETGFMLVTFTCPDEAQMPHSAYDAHTGSWRQVGAEERRDLAQEYARRIALVMAAGAFSSGLTVTRVGVEADASNGTGCAFALEFTRVGFYSVYAPAAERLAAFGLDRSASVEVIGNALRIVPDEYGRVLPGVHVSPGDFGRFDRSVAPRDDPRSLPPELRDMLHADTAAELEVFEADDDPAMRRYRQIDAERADDPQKADADLRGLMSELEASCALAELGSEGPVQSQYCDSYVGRVLLPLLDDTPQVRTHRVPDALYRAQYEVTVACGRAGDFDQALIEARKLLDMASSAMQPYFVLINVLAQLDRHDELVEVAKRALSLSRDGTATAYLFYRTAFAYWGLGKRDVALACYRLVPPGEYVSQSALQESDQLMHEMGVSERPGLEAAMTVARGAGLPIPVTQEVSQRIADAAVLLTDYGFFHVAARCLRTMAHLTSSDELGCVLRSLDR